MPASEMALHVPIPDATITVGPKNCDYEDLQSAMIGANDGDIILVYEGANLVFTQAVEIDKDLMIIAEPSLDLRQEQVNIVKLEITAPTVGGVLFWGDTVGKKIYFKGFKFSYNNGNIIDCRDMDFTFDHCLLEGTNSSSIMINMEYASHLDFLESEINIIAGSGYGVRLQGTSEALFRESKISVPKNGIELNNDTNVNIIRAEIYAEIPLAMYSDGTANLYWSYLEDITGSAVVVHQDYSGTINFYGCSIHTTGIPIYQDTVTGVINWDQSSSCSGSNSANIIQGTFNRRTPQDLWETAALEDVAVWSQVGQADHTITVGPTAGVYDYTDLQSAIAASVNGDWIICYQGGDYNITITQNISQDLHIVAADFSYDRMGVNTDVLPSITIMASTISRAFKLYNGGKVYFGGIGIYTNDAPFMHIAGQADATFEHCWLKFTNNISSDVGFLLDANVVANENELDFVHCKIVHGDGYLVKINDNTAFVNFVNCNIKGENSPTVYLNYPSAIVGFDRVTGEQLGNPAIEITSLGGQLTFRNSVTINAIECIKQGGGTIHAHDVTLNASALNSLNQSAGTFNWGHVNILQGPIVAGGTITPMHTPAEDYEYEVVGGVTRQVFESVEDALDTKGNYPCKRLGAGTVYDSVGYMSAIAPWDYASIAAIEILVIPEANNATFDYDVAVHYSADGEAYNAHAASTLAPNFNAVLDQKQAIDISSLFSSLAAGDSFGIEFTNQESSDQINILGVRFRWRKA